MKIETYIFENNTNDLPLYTILGLPEDNKILVSEDRLLRAFDDMVEIEYVLSEDEEFNEIYEYFCDIALQGRVGFNKLIEEFGLK